MSKPSSLRPDATKAQLLHATAANHTAWFRAQAQARGGREERVGGVTWFCGPHSQHGFTFPFPRLSRGKEAEVAEAIVGACRRSPTQSSSCWALYASRSRRLGAMLAARGFEWGWQPHWMALPTGREAATAGAGNPTGLRITIDDDSDWQVDGLPYYRPDDVPWLRALAAERPRRFWHFAARLDGAIVGHTILFVTPGPRGIGGIYNMGVLETSRLRGIGRALMAAACRVAREERVHWLALNSAADRFYEQIGFTSLGWGQTWWIHERQLSAPIPSPEQIAFVEALGLGDIAALDAAWPGARGLDLDAQLTCGSTPAELAVQSGRPQSARWLEARGAALDPIAAWQLGWRRKARALAAANPAALNRRRGDWQTTLLHDAVSSNDLPLARFLVEAGADLTACDAEVGTTPLDWAHYFRRTEMIELMERASRR